MFFEKKVVGMFTKNKDKAGSCPLGLESGGHPSRSSPGLLFRFAGAAALGTKGC